MRSIKFTAIAAALAVALVAGCKGEKTTEVVQTVDWYKLNKPERLAMIERCTNNPGQLAATPNCVNANRAAQSLVWSSKSDSAIRVKPLTAEQLRAPASAP